MNKYTDIKGVFFDLGWTLEVPFNGDWMITNRFREVCGWREPVPVPQPEMNSALTESSKYLQQSHKMSTPEEEFEQFTRFYEILGGKIPQLGMTH